MRLNTRKLAAEELEAGMDTLIIDAEARNEFCSRVVSAPLN
jgi:hypothetical protein